MFSRITTGISKAREAINKSAKKALRSTQSTTEHVDTTALERFKEKKKPFKKTTLVGLTIREVKNWNKQDLVEENVKSAGKKRELKKKHVEKEEKEVEHVGVV